MRANAASADGAAAVMARACSTVGGHGGPVAPQAEIAVRSASMGSLDGGQRAGGRQDLRGSGRARRGEHRSPVAGPQQLGDLRVRAVLDELADPVAAVLEPAAFAVDHREARLAGHDALQAGRVGSGSLAGFGRRGVGGR